MASGYGSCWRGSLVGFRELDALEMELAVPFFNGGRTVAKKKAKKAAKKAGKKKTAKKKTAKKKK